MTIAVCIPTYNESENIERTLNELFSLHLPDLSVLVIDDNSPDGTADIIRSLQKSSYGNHLQLLHRPGKLGLGTAYIAGFKRALDEGAQFIFEMDADGSHDPKDIPKLLAAVRNGSDVAIGSRRVEGGAIVGWNFFRHFASSGAMMASRMLLGIKTHDVTAGFRCYSHKVLNSFDLDSITSNGYAFQEEMIWLCEKYNFTVTEIPITFKDREHGESKLSRKDIFEFFKTIARLRFTNPERYTKKHD